MIEDGCIISGIFYSRNDIHLMIPPNLLIVTYPLVDGTVTFIFGTNDDMKQKPVKHWAGMEWNPMMRNAIPDNSMLDVDQYDLFSLPIFPVCQDPCDSLLLSLSLYYNCHGNKTMGELYANHVEDTEIFYYTSLKQAAKCKSVKRLTAIRAPPPGVCLQAAVLR